MAWIFGNRYLSISEMQNNADIIHAFFRAREWTDEAIAAMLANMQSESTINPGIWEGLKEPPAGVTNVGYGLVQWTPYTKYSEWAGEGWQNNGNVQCVRIIYELANKLQWIATSTYPMSFEQFTLSDAAPEYLAYVWMYNYERPADLNQPLRKKRARYWYNYIKGHSPGTIIPIWLLFKIAKGGRF